MAYLGAVDEPVSQLQLVGCACLYLASKIEESTIVAAESYAACSADIFTPHKLMAKEAQVYGVLEGNTCFPSLHE